MKTQYINPIDFLKNQYDTILPEWIVYDQNVIPEYYRIEGSRHDGTLVFTMDNILKTLMPLIKMESYYKPTAPQDLSSVKSLRYTIGDIKLETEFGTVDLPSGRYLGQTDKISIPVKCEYIY